MELGLAVLLGFLFQVSILQGAPLHTPQTRALGRSYHEEVPHEPSEVTMVGWG